MTTKTKIPVAAIGAGRFDADDDAVVARLHRAAKAQSVCMMTEVTPKQWRAIKKNLPTGWKAVHLNEYLIAWDARVKIPKGVKARWSWVSRGFFNRGRIQIRAKVGEMRLADRAVKGDEGCYFSVVHLPAHLQAGDHYTANPEMRDEVLAHQQALATLGLRSWRRKHNHPRRRQCLSGDVNVDLFRPEWRGELRRQLNMEGVWRASNLPHEGDMGHRLITGAWTYGFGTSETWGEVLATPQAEEGLDHRMVEVWA